MIQILDRRLFLGTMGALAVAGLAGRAISAAPEGEFQMWHSPGCGCCHKWAKHIEAAFGRELTVTPTSDIAAVKQANGVPAALQSCHTARIRGLVIEGHVPATDIKRLLGSNDRNARGLAVPGMPAGSPGMDMGHAHKEAFKVHAFTGKGTHWVYASHG